MGVSHSNANESASDTTAKQNANRQNASDKIFAIFNRPRYDEQLDSTDSEITLLEHKKGDRSRRRGKGGKDSNQDGDSSQDQSARSVGVITDGKDDGEGVKSGLAGAVAGGIVGATAGEKDNCFDCKTKLCPYRNQDSSLEYSQVPQAIEKRSSQEVTEPTKSFSLSFAPDLPPGRGSSGHVNRNGLNRSNSEVMQKYQRYSREPPERDQNHQSCPAVRGRTSCCRQPCGPAVPSHNICPQYCQPNRAHVRHTSEPVVSVKRNYNSVTEKKASIVTGPKSAPGNYQSGTNINRAPPKIPSPPPPPAKNSNPNQPNNSQSFTKNLISDTSSPSNYSRQMYNPRGYSNYNHSNRQHPPQPQQYRRYPYEEPTDSTSYSHESSCCTNNCNGYNPCSQHRACTCQCMCGSDNCFQRNLSDDQLSCCSDSTKSDFMNLAYQRTGDYPELVDELENTLSQRNRERVQKTMQQFEILSRQNKNLEKPIFDDEDNSYSCRHHCRCKRGRSGDCKCSCCKNSESNDNRKFVNRSNTDTYKSRSESLSKRPTHFPNNNTQPRSPGYVEKVARYMDPNYNDKARGFCNNKLQSPRQNDSGNGSWQMDTRKGEWVKVNPQNNHYDFENNYPPLPPRPHSSHVYDRHEYCNRNQQQVDQTCACNKCRRKR